jgi:hypothetical protein
MAVEILRENMTKGARNRSWHPDVTDSGDQGTVIVWVTLLVAPALSVTVNVSR